MTDDLKKTPWATADKVRANTDAAEYKHLVLGPISGQLRLPSAEEAIAEATHAD